MRLTTRRFVDISPVSEKGRLNFLFVRKLFAVDLVETNLAEKHTDITFILAYTPDFQREFKKFFAQKQLYEFIAEKQKIPLEPPSKEADLAHNHYIKVIYNTQLLKFASLGDLLIHAIKHNNYLSYGLAGRALIEHVAAWRYYLVEKYSKLIIAGKELSFEDMLELIRLDEQFLFGTKFDWPQWLNQDYAALENTYRQSLQDKKNKKTPEAPSKHKPVNVLTCVEKLATALPKFGVFYDMFCDLVHPNIGTNFILYSISREGSIAIDRSCEIQIGQKLIEDTFGDLMLLTYGQVNELTKSHFSALLGEEPSKFIFVKLAEVGSER